MAANTTDLEKRLWEAADELRANSKLNFLKAAPGFEPGVEVLQTSALPLGYAAIAGFPKLL